MHRLAKDNILLEPGAIEYLMGKDDPMVFARSALAAMRQQPLFLTLEDLAEFSQESVSTKVAPRDVRPSLVSADEVKTMVDLKGRPTDITGNSTCEGNIEDFARYFQDRFQTMRRLLQRRRELVGAGSIRLVRRRGGDVKIIALVNEARTTKNGHLLMELEDDDDHILALIRKDSPLKNESIIADEVIGVCGKMNEGGDMIYVENVIRPDVPLNNDLAPNDSSNLVAFLSDVHYGSNTFLQKQWDRMMDWVKTDGVTSGLTYMVFPGDVVDGIGIFPGQEKELLVHDIYEQYRGLAEMLKDIPDGIKVVVQPGNHDAVRPAEPQPAFFKEVTDMFDSSVMFIGNPCWLEIEGRSILSYHGRSIDDWVNNVRHLTYENPLEVMKEMLVRRHLAPMYGGKTPLAPEEKDYMIIDRVPDIFVTGHVHGAGATMYKGIRMINASTWQDQTSFQKMHNFNPDPAKVPLVHLGTGKITMMHFNN